MDIHERIDVEAGPEAVWHVLADPYAVVACIPGAEITGEREDGGYDAKIGIKFGPTRIGFKGRVEIDLDAASRTGRVVGRGKDSIGGTRVQAEARFDLQPVGTGSSVVIDGTVDISGRLATFIESGANIVVARTSAEFAERLAQRIKAADAASTTT